MGVDPRVMSDLITTLLTSAVVSAPISFFISKHLKDQDYQNEYFKIVLQKRLEAYEGIAKILLILKNVKYNEIGMYFDIFSNGKEYFYEFKDEINSTLPSYSHLYTPDITNKISELSTYLDQIKVRNTSKEELKHLGIEYYEEILHLGMKIEEQYQKDLLTLHQIETFLKQKLTKLQNLSSQLERIKK